MWREQFLAGSQIEELLRIQQTFALWKAGQSREEDCHAALFAEVSTSSIRLLATPRAASVLLIRDGWKRVTVPRLSERLIMLAGDADCWDLLGLPNPVTSA